MMPNPPSPSGPYEAVTVTGIPVKYGQAEISDVILGNISPVPTSHLHFPELNSTLYSLHKQYPDITHIYREMGGSDCVN